jgi:hypothetical protein
MVYGVTNVHPSECDDQFSSYPWLKGYSLLGRYTDVDNFVSDKNILEFSIFLVLYTIVTQLV